MRLPLSFAVLIALLPLNPLARAGKPAVLLHCARQLEPTSTLEFRFAEPMVAADRIGKRADVSPVTFLPEVQGSFTWLSQRSGVFTPEKGLPLSTTFQVTLREGLAKADGQPLAAEFRETIETPPMQLKGSRAAVYFPKEDAPAEPKFSLLFNVNVDANDVARFCRFENKTGDSVVARAQQASPAEHPEHYFPPGSSRDRSLLTWAERFQARRAQNEQGEERVPKGPRGNQVLVTPVQPLPPGEGWKLVIRAGLPAREEGLRLLAAAEVAIGTIRPFEVVRAEPTNHLNQGRQFSVAFSKRLGKEITPANVQRWIQVEPAPKKLKARVKETAVEFTGEFALNTDYRVRIRPGLPSAEPFVLGSGFDQTFAFKQVPSRLYLEEFATHQLSTGHRQFHLIAVNVPRVRVSAKLFRADTLPAALKAYRQYFERRRNVRAESDDPYAPVNPDLLPGQVLWQKEIAGTAGIDDEQEIALDWNEILGANQTGAVLLTAEQIGEPAEPGKRPGTQALIQITDLGLVWKRSENDCLVHVFSLGSGRAVAGAKVQLVNEKGASIGEAITDQAGLAALPKAKDAQWLYAERETDRHLIGFRDGGNQIAVGRLRNMRYFDDGDEGAAREDRPMMLFTERPVYKPGETVHLKGIARDWRDGRPRIPAGVPARVTAFDSRDRAFFTKNVTLSDAGSFAEDVALPKGVLGGFRAELAYTDRADRTEPAATHSFQVEEYRPNAFEIGIDTPAHAIGPAQVELRVGAKYYMGKPLAKAQLTWSLEASDDGFAPAGFDGFAFGNAIHEYRLNRALDRVAHFSEQGKGELGAEGGFTIGTIVPLNTKAPQPRTARVLCEITDLNQQTVSHSGTFTVHSSEFYLGLNRPASVVREGETLPIDVIAVRSDGSPIPD
ncbi:MAG: MG2 domain-containing protein, partial [Verrucomicrobiota bacterium]|nr:MG2 domain-containing protein [Verrucomicrobiota bacterium]